MNKDKSIFLMTLEKVEIVLLYIAGSLVILNMIIVTIDVFLRNIFNSPIPGVYELVGFLFASAVALGLPYAQAKKENISINIVTKYLPIKIQKMLAVIAYFIAIIIVAILFWENSHKAFISFQVMDYTMGLVQLPLWPAKSMLALSLFVLLIRLFVDQYLLIKNPIYDEENF